MKYLICKDSTFIGNFLYMNEFKVLLGNGFQIIKGKWCKIGKG